MLTWYYVALLFLFVLFIFTVVIFQPRFAVRYLKRQYPNVLFDFEPESAQKNNESKFVALTIDDGPSSNLTSQILDILKQHEANCTFFLIGSHIEQANSHEEGSGTALVQRMLDEGHEVGNHTWHDRATIRLEQHILEAEIQACEALVSSITKQLHPDPASNHSSGVSDDHRSHHDQIQSKSSSRSQLKWFRPGCGWFNSNIIETAKKYGYRVALGSIYPHDPQITWTAWNSWHVLRYFVKLCVFVFVFVLFFQMSKF